MAKIIQHISGIEGINYSDYKEGNQVRRIITVGLDFESRIQIELTDEQFDSLQYELNKSRNKPVSRFTED